MTGKLYKLSLAGLAVALLIGASFSEWSLTRDRDALGLTRYTELKGAPPVLVLTTVALGGFRGLISNALWIRASDLQDQDKFFELVQLADWITKLEPNFAQVWLMQGWNMAFNISVKFKDPEDRWRWVERGIELLRDDGLRYNPYDILIHRELAWIFFFKMGGNLDDAHFLYKWEWATEMQNVFGGPQPKWDELMNPQTEDARRRAALLRDKYKMDPKFMKQLDDTWGPLEWRLPEAHAIYWSAMGVEQGNKNARRINTNDLIQIRREIYQSMLLSFHRGRLIRLPKDRTDWRQTTVGPNLAIVDRVNKSYEDMMTEDPKNRDQYEIPHRYFLLDAVYYLQMYNRTAEAQRWYSYLIQHYPNKPTLENDPKSLPATLSVDEYIYGRLQQEMGTLAQINTQAMLEGLETQAYYSMATDDDDRAQGLRAMSQRVYNLYQKKIAPRDASDAPLKIPTLEEIRRDALKNLLGSDELSDDFKARLATKTGQPFTPSTNAVPVGK